MLIAENGIVSRRSDNKRPGQSEPVRAEKTVQRPFNLGVAVAYTDLDYRLFHILFLIIVR